MSTIHDRIFKGSSIGSMIQSVERPEGRAVTGGMSEMFTDARGSVRNAAAYATPGNEPELFRLNERDLMKTAAPFLRRTPEGQNPDYQSQLQGPIPDSPEVTADLGHIRDTYREYTSDPMRIAVNELERERNRGADGQVTPTDFDRMSSVGQQLEADLAAGKQPSELMTVAEFSYLKTTARQADGVSRGELEHLNPRSPHVGYEEKRLAREMAFDGRKAEDTSALAGMSPEEQEAFTKDLEYTQDSTGMDRDQVEAYGRGEQSELSDYNQRRLDSMFERHGVDKESFYSSESAASGPEAAASGGFSFAAGKQEAAMSERAPIETANPADSMRAETSIALNRGGPDLSFDRA